MPILARIRDGAVIALCLAGVVVCLQASRLLDTARDELSAVSRETGAALTEWREYSRESLGLLRDPKTQQAIGLLLRSGDDLARTVKRVNVTLDSLNTAIKRTDENLNGQVLPAATAAIRHTETISGEASAAIAAARSAIEAASADLHGTAASLESTLAGMRGTTEAATAAIEQMRIVAADPAITGSLRNIELTTQKSAESMANVETMTRRMASPGNLLYRVTKEIVIIVGRIFAP